MFKTSLLSVLWLALLPEIVYAESIRVATFNVSMEATNYGDVRELAAPEKVLIDALISGENQQIKNIAEIIQRVAPDIILLNEFDYYPDATPSAPTLFIQNYLNKSQHGQSPIDYPYYYIAPVNTGVPTPFDLDNDGKASGTGTDAFGYGIYPGQYGMVLLSRFPIDTHAVRSLQLFRWKDMPNAQSPVDPATKEPWYNEAEWAEFRLSSKSHWDIPIKIKGERLHILAMHPTPPTFDGPEDRNGKRNHDEIRLMADYLQPETAKYIYDDQGGRGATQARTFVIAGDLNAADIGDKYRPGVIEQLLNHPLINATTIPVSEGGEESATEQYSARYTAYWGARADYVLPSKNGLKVTGSGVFWPGKKSPLYRLVKDRKSSSDHRLVWLDLEMN